MEEVKKLLQINVTANVGSTGRIAEQIGSVAMNAGWESYIAYGRYANPSKSRLIKIGTKLGLFWHLLESRLFDNQGLASRVATRKLVQQIESIKPDVIHLHNIHGYYLNYKILFDYLNSTNIPVVWTLHDCWSFTGHCAHFVEANCNKWREECDSCVLKNKYPKTYFSSAKTNYELKRQLFNSANLTLVPVSEWLSNFVEQSFLKDKAKRVIHNGININTFKPLNTTTNDFINILGVSSVWNESKGLYDFYKLRNILDPNRFNITLVGLTKQQIDELPKGIVGIERTNSIEELVQMYNNTDIFVNPTYADTFPTTNLEALACGTPVITYRTGGSPESITPDTGIVVEQGNISAIVQAIEEISSKGKNYYADACRKHAEENFDKDSCFEKYINMYTEILNNTK